MMAQKDHYNLAYQSSLKTQKNNKQRKNLVIVVVVLTVLSLIVVLGPCTPIKSNSVLSIKPIICDSSSFITRSFCNTMPVNGYEAKLSKSDIVSFLGFANNGITLIDEDVSIETELYSALYYDDGSIHSVTMHWTLHGGWIEVIIEPRAKIPVSIGAIVKPWYKPYLINGYKCYYVKRILNSQDTGLNEYDIFLVKDKIVVHCFCSENTVQEMLSFVDKVVQTTMQVF